MAALFALAVHPFAAQATEEAIIAYDAKSNGMGLTGTAWLNNAAAAYHNVANLGAVKRFDAVLAIGPNISRVKAPYLSLDGGGTFSHLTARSQASLTPLGFVGLAWRPHHLVAVGLASGVSEIAGVVYRNVPLTLLSPISPSEVQGGAVNALAMLWDTRLSVALNPLSWLSIGGGWRMGFAHQELSYKVGSATPVHLSGNGRRFGGAYAGLTIKPHRQVRLGASYRSKLSVGTPGLPGTSVALGPVIEPHHFTAGIAVQLANNRLLLAADYKHWFYTNAAKREPTAKGMVRDAMSAHAGVEWLALPMLPLRAGVLVARSKTTPFGGLATRMPPGFLVGGTLGAGLRLPSVDVDLAFGYGGMNSKMSSPPAFLSGRYGLDAWLIQLSANVHI